MRRRKTMSLKAASRYADAVVDVLSREFNDLRTPVTVNTLKQAVVKHAQNPSDIEFIVDSPATANWRLKADLDHHERVRLACYRFDPTDADLGRERRINAALRSITAT